MRGMLASRATVRWLSWLCLVACGAPIASAQRNPQDEHAGDVDGNDDPEETGTGALPVDVLRQMVRAEGTLVTELFRWYAEAARRAVPRPFGGFGFPNPLFAAPEPSAPPETEQLKREVTELRARLEALETRPARKKAAKRKAVSRRRAR